MIVETLVLGDLGTNTYIAIGDDNQHAVIIDPAAESQRILNYLEEKGLSLEAILITHGHYDHIGAVSELVQALKVPVFTHEKEATMMSEAALNLSSFFSPGGMKAKADRLVEHGDTIDFGHGLKFKVLIVPGHSPASVCYYCSEGDHLFAGDTLFASSIGRMDFFKGPEGTLIEQIKTHLLPLPDDTRVYPGHGGSTTIIREKRRNPYLS